MSESKKIQHPFRSSSPEGKLSFFRQSSWMLFAGMASGLLMLAVHKVVGNQRFMSQEEYGVFMTLLQVLNMMMVPMIGIQMVFAQQAGMVNTEADRRKLAGTVKGVLGLSFLLAMLLGIGLLFWQQRIAEAYKISNPVAIWITLGLGLTAVINPVMMGLLLGRLNFLWAGWSVMVAGVGRLVAVGVIVVFLGGAAAGAMTGVLLGMLAALSVAAWYTRDVWLATADKFDFLDWLKRVVPLIVGFGAATVMLSVDMVVVQRFFPKEETGYYAAAGMIGRALVFLTIPLTQVMFPRIVRSAARSEKSNVLFQALTITALLGGCAAVGCSFFPELPLKMVYDDSYLKIAPLVPLFAWCMLPLTMANVLINNLMARKKFKVVPWLALVSCCYWLALWRYTATSERRFEDVIQMLGGFGIVFLLVCVIFSFRKDASTSYGVEENVNDDSKLL